MRRNPRLFRLTATVALTALLWDATLPLAAVAQPRAAAAAAGRTGPARPGPARPQSGRSAGPRRPHRRHDRDRLLPHRGRYELEPGRVNYPVATGDAFWTEPNARRVAGISASRIGLPGEPSWTSIRSTRTVCRPRCRRARSICTCATWRRTRPGRCRRRAGWSLFGRGPLRRRGRRHPDRRPRHGPGRRGAGHRPRPVAAGGAGPDRDDQRHRHFPGQRRAGADGCLPDRHAAGGTAAGRAACADPAVVAQMPGGNDLSAWSWSDSARITARSGIRRSRPAGPPIAMATGPISRPGAGPGSTPRPGASRRSITAAGCRSAAAGAGPPASSPIAGPPVYAPALVTFIGIGVGVGLGAALASGSIGWVPLGPREPFHPWYHASANYVRAVNVTHVTNINTNVRINTYVNRAPPRPSPPPP